MLKKVMLLAAMLAMVLAAAVPALAQVNNGNVANVACVQTAVQGDVAQAAASQYGDATNINIQTIAQECNIAVAQVNTIINDNDFDKKYDKDYGKKYYDKDYDKDYGKKYYYDDYGKKYYYEDGKKYYYYEKAPSYQYEYEKDYAAPSVQYQYKYEKDYVAPSVQYQYESDKDYAAAELPSTGGSSLIALGAGVLLVAGGLLARRIVR